MPESGSALSSRFPVRETTAKRRLSGDQTKSTTPFSKLVILVTPSPEADAT